MKIRHRADLEVFPQVRRSHRVWVVKDPVSLRYFQLRAEEYLILRSLDGRSSLDSIRKRFDQEFAPRRITSERLHRFIGSLHQNGLLITDSIGQGDPLLNRHQGQLRSSRFAAFANPLAIRFRGFDPDRFLTWLVPKCTWVISNYVLGICATIVLVAAGLLAMRFEEFWMRLPEVNALISPGNLVWLVIAIAGTKLLHELGHAISCKYFGAECHEMGIMLLVFTPCLYCNVTDAWKLDSRFKRIAIGAAGIVVEILLAAICTLLWWFSEPGLLNTICINVVLVCSIGTLLLNGNPLLRYDGYYILSDLLDMPNLWQDSRNEIRRSVWRIFAGLDLGRATPTVDRRVVLIAYGLASMVYRVFVMASILYFVYLICKPAGLEIVFQLLAAFLFAGLILPATTGIWNAMNNPLMRRQISKRRMLACVFVTAAIVLAFFKIPLPCRIESQALIEPRDAKGVYVSVPGVLQSASRHGTRVVAGQPLAELKSPELARELETARGKYAVQKLRVRQLESLRSDDPTIASQLPAANEILDDLEERVEQLRLEIAKLTLRAPADGIVLPPPSRKPAGMQDDKLERWNGTPMDPSNVGAVLERNTLLCLVGQENAFEAAVFIRQSDLEFIMEGQTVRLLFDGNRGAIVDGKVIEIAREKLDRVPEQLGADQRIANRPDESGTRIPEQAIYKAIVELEPSSESLRLGSRGVARISVAPQPLSQRLARFLAETFKPVI